MQTQITLQPALIFIPDITGFTQFVTDVETAHARHIIEELLEIMIDANQIGMEISEVEGDAILFYRFGNAPTAAELLAQIQKMFVNFHAHLRKYTTHRICNCGACRTATDLTLKFVAHYGDITITTIKEYRKLFGKDVIVAHRLLKNQIADHEYALVTHNLVQACPQWVDIEAAAWAPFKEGSEDYDSGKVEYCFLPLKPLLHHLPDPVAEDYSIPGAKTGIFHSKATIHAPIEMVFNVISDVAWRSKWIPGTLPEVVDINSELPQHGRSHRCLAQSPVIVAHDYGISANTITFTETEVTRESCVVYTLNRVHADRTEIMADMFMKRSFLKKLVFDLFMKKKVQNTYDQSWENLNAYCHGLLEAGHAHRNSMILEERVAAA